ncbi:hypothetical protein F8388_016585 [Cannabis sativa]|uniref:RNase H type-1 domain-containing protein n=1 Tax=Cannabis sativa TaxID=3483 RepID=A0A7J6EYE4_CANSA|nr:hypothetical protein F8388_016585 [Cannabis sativa]
MNMNSVSVPVSGPGSQVWSLSWVPSSVPGPDPGSGPSWVRVQVPVLVPSWVLSPSLDPSSGRGSSPGSWTQSVSEFQSQVCVWVSVQVRVPGPRFGFGSGSGSGSRSGSGSQVQVWVWVLGSGLSPGLGSRSRSQVSVRVQVHVPRHPSLGRGEADLIQDPISIRRFQISDATLDHNYYNTGLGLILKKGSNQVLPSASIQKPGDPASIFAEGQALLEDFLHIVSKVNGQWQDNSALSSLVLKIRQSFSNFPATSLHHISRQFNIDAHSSAKDALMQRKDE